MKKEFKEILIIGFALFAMFFGAGNMIFPPFLGFHGGTKYFPILVGFLLSGVGFPLLGIISCAKAGGSADKLLQKVNVPFAVIMGSAIVLAIGPLYAIPRTGATTFEMMVQPLMPTASPIIINAIYFIITFLLVANPTSVVDNVGKFLTPALLVTLAIILIKGFIDPISTIADTGSTQGLGYGFAEGYQTMDAIASIIMASIVITELRSLGVTDTNQQIKKALQAGAISSVLLGIIYLGLGHLGAVATGMFSQDITRVALLQGIVAQLLGNPGKIILGVAVGLACLTTSIGLTASVSEYFVKLSKGKLNYKVLALITSIIGYALSIIGVERLLQVIGPFLGIMYPPVMIIILLNLTGKALQYRGVYVTAVIVSLISSIFSTFAADPFKMAWAQGVDKFQKALPGGAIGFGWVPLTLVAILVGYILSKALKNTPMGDRV